MTVKQAAELWNISERRVRILCNEGRIVGAKKENGVYTIPDNAQKPSDKRVTRHISIPKKYKKIFEEIDNLKQQLAQKRPLTQGELQRLQEEFLIEFTYDSNAIEGSTMTLQETALVIEGITIDKKPIKEHLEVVGHRDAFLYVESLVKENAPITERVIRDIHSLVLIDRPLDRGVYRKIPVRIMGASHTPPDPILVPDMMANLINEFKHSKRHPIEIAALFHLKFEGIHPFVDGNGRTGRLIMNLYLMQNGYLPINIKFTDRKAYYDSFDKYYNKKSADDLVFMISRYLKERFERILSFI